MTVIKIGGSTIFEDNKVVTDRVLDTIQILEDNNSKINGIVVGGGDLARQYIETGADKDLSSDDLDWMGINATHSNAKFVNRLLGDSYNFHKNLSEVEFNENIITGGTEPGHTTDAVSVMLAAELGSSRVYSLSDVDGVYDTRDADLENADRINSATTDEIESIIEDQSSKPGRSIPIDRLAVQEIRDNNITFTMFDGTDPTNLEKVLKGKSVGTTINP